MAFTQKHASLKNLRVNLANGLAVNALSFNIERNPVYDVKQPGKALVPSQVYMGEGLPTLSMEVYFDDVVDLSKVLPNQAITSFDIVSPLDANSSIFAAEFFAKFPPSTMVFGAPKTTLVGDKISTITFDILCNVLNPGANGGYPVDAPATATV
ncbi:MAG: hypothetical protein KY445_04720 [Armatimonadetes bacterium]|nr:hypothetical protein [Armatimonadota bacterium]